MVMTRMKSRPLFMMALFDPGIGSKVASLNRLSGNLLTKSTKAAIIKSSALRIDDSLALSRMDLATGEYLMEE